MLSEKDPVNGSPSAKVIPLFPQAPSDAPPPRSVEAECERAEEGARAPASDPPGAEAGAMPRDLYTAAQVERFLGISVNRLRYWARIGLVPPSGRKGQLRFYTFQDLVSLRATLELLREGLSTRRLKRSLDRLRRQLPASASPLAEMRVSCAGDAVVVRHQDKPFEAETGQILLDFSVGELREHVVQLVKPGADSGTPKRQSAFDWYLEGCRYESMPEAMDRAEAAYRRAIELDPKLACAYTNLGNIRYHAGSADDARALYEKALELEPDQPEAHYNLGFLTYEEGDPLAAIPQFERAIELDPDFGDAHFNLGMALEETGRRRQARQHFAAYLSLEPNGPWSDLARRRLG